MMNRQQFIRQPYDGLTDDFNIQLSFIHLHNENSVLTKNIIQVAFYLIKPCPSTAKTSSR